MISMSAKSIVQRKALKCIFCIGVLLSFACSSEQPNINDERFLTWRIGAAISYNFPAEVSEAYGVNYQEDWTSVMLSYTNLNLGNRRNLNKIRERSYADYQGYKLPLHSLINFTPSQLGLGKKTLPDEIYIYWWVPNSRTNYVTVVTVTEKMKAAMTRQYPNPSPRLKGQNCYQTDFLFGLLPDGRAKLWLKGCRIYTYVGVFEPAKVMLDPKSHLAENRLIPWNKVEQIWYDKELYRMQSLTDVTRELNTETKQ